MSINSREAETLWKAADLLLQRARELRADAEVLEREAKQLNVRASEILDGHA